MTFLLHKYSISQMVSMALFKVRCWSILLWTVKLEYFHENSRICVASYYKYSTISPLLLLQSFPLPLTGFKESHGSILAICWKDLPPLALYMKTSKFYVPISKWKALERGGQSHERISSTQFPQNTATKKKGKKYSALADPWAKSTVFS